MDPVTKEHLAKLSRNINRLPLSANIQQQLFAVLRVLVEGKLESDGETALEKLGEISVIESDVLGEYTEWQRNLEEITDILWDITDDADLVNKFSCRIGEFFKKLHAEIFVLKKNVKLMNDRFALIESELERMRVSEDQLLLGSLACQVLLKIGMLCKIKEPHIVAVTRSPADFANRELFMEINSYLENPKYDKNQIYSAIVHLKANRVEVAHPSDPSTTANQLMDAIHRVYPTNEKLADEALALLDLLKDLSRDLNQPLFIKTT